jgi:hypothetical protein
VDQAVVIAGALTLAAVALPPPPADAWKSAPRYLPLFAPAGPRGAAYQIYVS